MMPPNNDSISLLKDEIGVTGTTLYKWRNESHIAGSATSRDGQGAEQWSSKDKYLIVMDMTVYLLHV
jgi:transposase-like protein